MGPRRWNRPVSTADAKGALTLGMGLPNVCTTCPCARAPPLPVLLESPELPTDPRTCRGQARQGRAPPGPRAKRRGDAATSPLPNAGLAKLAQLQLATLPVDPLAAYPCSNQSGRGNSAAASSESPAIRCASSTANPCGATHAYPV